MAKDPEVKVSFRVFNKEFREGLKEINDDTTRLRKEFKLQDEQMKHTSTESGKLENNIKRLSKEKENVRKKIELTEKQLAKAKEYYGENSEEVRRLENQLLDLQISEQKIINTIDESNEAIREQSGLMDETAVSAKNYRERLAEIGDSAINLGEKLQNVGQGITDFGKSWSTKVTAPIVAGSVAVFKASMDYESAFAGVRKTVDATEEEYERLSDGIREMTKVLPASATEIAAVAEAAGQLGIENENILSFSRTMIDLGEATNLSAETAATEFARFANIVGMSQADFDKLGSVVVDLGNNLATTEAEIVSMAMRLAGAGAQIGLSESDIMALAASLSSVGIQAEMGGSAISKAMIAMQVATSTGHGEVQKVLQETGKSLRDLEMMASHDSEGFGEIAYSLGMTKKELQGLIKAGNDLENFAKIAGMTGEEFKKAFEEDAIQALGSFINGLGNAEEAGESAIIMLDEMGITEVRLRDALLRAGNASELFAGSVDMASDAWGENIALTEEAEQRYGTSESKLRIMWNRIKDVAITLGNALVPAVMGALEAAEPFFNKLEEGAQAFADMDEEQQRTILKLIALVAAIGPASLMLGGLVNSVGGVVKITGTLTKSFGNVGSGGLLGKIGLMAMKAGPIGLAVGSILGLTTVIRGLSSASNESLEEINDSIEKRHEEIVALDEVIDRFEDLQDKNKLSTDEVLRYMDIMTLLKEAKNEDTIKALTDEQAQLLEKSGFTNEEMQQFLELNDTLVEKTPATNQALSEQGEAYVTVADGVREVNDLEMQRLLNNTQAELITKMDEQKENLIKQAELQQEIEELELKRNTTLENINTNSSAITETNKEIDALYDQMEISTHDQQMNLLGQVKEKQKLLEELKTEEIKLDGNLITMNNQLETKKDSLETTEKEVSEFDRLAEQYADQLLYQLDINAEKGEEIKALQKAWDETEKLLELNNKKLDTGEQTTVEHERTNEQLQNQKRKIQDAIGLLEDMNEVAQQKIDKDIYADDRGTIDDINRRAAETVSKTVLLRTALPSHSSDAYAKGTNFHKGGQALLGEEGPELVKQGREWFLANFGLFDLKRGAKVFTAQQTERMLKSGKAVKGYAEGTNNHISDLNMFEPFNLTEIAKSLVRMLPSTNISNQRITLDSGDVNLEGKVEVQVFLDNKELSVGLAPGMSIELDKLSKLKARSKGVGMITL